LSWSKERSTETGTQNKVLAEMISVIAWILWALIALNALFWLIISVGRGDPGGRWLYRMQGLIWLAGVLVTITLPISKFHLIWIFPLGGMVPFAIMKWRMQRQMDMGTSPVALQVRQHLQEQSGGEVWNWPEMLRLFKVSESTSPRAYAEIFQSSEFAKRWVTQEPQVGEVKVIRRADKVKGTLLFIDSPRFYFNWSPD
jgi:hypothetical protein